jgi:PAS domain S-box-containing protein
MEREAEEKEIYKVLVVEDDEVDQLAFKKAAKDNSLPYQCTFVGSVAQAQRVLREDSFDVAVIDYRLGDGTAFDIYVMLKNTPTIFTTGAGDEEIAIKAMKSGVYDYLVKDPSRNYLKVLPGVIRNAIIHKINEDKIKEYHSNLERLVKERTEQLEAEKELLAVTLSSMSDGVVAVDVEKRIVLFNRVVEDLTGWSFSEVQDRKVDEVFKVIKEKTGEYVNDIVDKVIASGQVEVGTEQDCLITKTGSCHPVAVSAAAIRNNNGNIVGIVIVLRDVTREREIDQMKSDFISSVSHELRSPLTSIRAYTESILQEPDMNRQTCEEFLKIIDEESERLARLIDSILEISRIESGRKEINLTEFDIVSVVKRVLSAMRPLAEKKRVKLESSIADGLDLIVADEGRIESVITNLVNNAIKFTPDGGCVGFSVQQQHDQVRISVSDTGVGIPKESLGKIFDRFYRVHRAGSRVQGTGLGLTIVREIVAMHGGRIEVESEEGRGSSFTVVLPLIAQWQPEKQTVNQSS